MAILAIALASSWFVLGDYKTLLHEFGPGRVWKYSNLNKRLVLPQSSKGYRTVNGSQLRDHIDYMIELNYDAICFIASYSGIKRHKKYNGECHTFKLMQMRKAAGGPEWDIPPEVCKDRGVDVMRRSHQCKAKRKSSKKPKKRCKTCKKRKR